MNRTAAPEPDLSLVFDQSPVGMALLLGEDARVQRINDRLLHLLDRSTHSLLGRPLLQTVPQWQGLGWEERVAEALHTGDTFEPATVLLDGKFHQFIFQPLVEKGVQPGRLLLTVSCVDGPLVNLNETRGQERLLRGVLLDAPVAMGIFRGRGMVIEWANAALLELWQRKPVEMLGLRLLDALPEFRDQQFPEILDGVFRTGAPYHEDECPILIGGRKGTWERCVTLDFLPLLEPGGAVSGIVLTAVDVTDLVRAREEASSAEARLRQSLEGARMGVWEDDLVSGVMNWNTVARELSGLPTDKALQYDQVFARIYDEDRDRVRKALWEAQQRGRGLYDQVYRVCLPGGKTRGVRSRGKVLFDTRGVAVRFVGVILDLESDAISSPVPAFNPALLPR